MDFQTCRMAVGNSEAAYERRVMQVGTSFREHQLERLQHPECVVGFATGSLVAHHQAQHGTIRGAQWDTTPNTPYLRLYRVYFHRVSWLVGFPVEGGRGRAMTRTNLLVHPMNRHVQDMIVIMENGEPSPPPMPLLKYVYVLGINKLPPPPPPHFSLSAGCRPENTEDGRGGGTGMGR